MRFLKIRATAGILAAGNTGGCPAPSQDSISPPSLQVTSWKSALDAGTVASRWVAGHRALDMGKFLGMEEATESFKKYWLYNLVGLYPCCSIKVETKVSASQDYHEDSTSPAHGMYSVNSNY